jgi:hypothetical protein
MEEVAPVCIGNSESDDGGGSKSPTGSVISTTAALTPSKTIVSVTAGADTADVDTPQSAVVAGRTLAINNPWRRAICSAWPLLGACRTR